MLDIKRVFNDEVTGWKRNIEFTYNGETYGLLLSWDEDYGFEDVIWNKDGNMISRPDWVKDYMSNSLDDEEEKGIFSFLYDLDALTYGVKA